MKVIVIPFQTLTSEAPAGRIAADFARQKTFCMGEEKMIPNALQAASAYVIPPILGFIVLIGLTMISLLRGGRKRANILFAGISIMF